MRTLARIAAAVAASSLAVPASFAAIGFSGYFSESPDFRIERTFQYDNSYTYLVRVCNDGGTPSVAGTLKIAIGRSSSNKEERHYNGVIPPADTCTNYEIRNVRRYGTASERTYPVSVSVSWQGREREFNSKNNSKVIPASTTSTPTGSWTSNTSDPSDNVYAGRTWYYPNGNPCYGYRYADGTYRYQDGRTYSYDSYGCSYGGNIVPGTSGYYWQGYPVYSGYSGYVEMTPQTQYPSWNSYNDYWPTQYYQASNVYSRPNFTVTRIGRDGSYRNILATVCNWGNDMSAFANLNLDIENVSTGGKYRSTDYVKLLNGQCRDISVSFSSFSFNRSGSYAFRATVDPDNQFSEQNESDNTFNTNVWYER